MKKMIGGFLLAAFTLLTAVSVTAQPSSWKLDPVHSGITYVVRHAMTPMMGQFKKFDVKIDWDQENTDNIKISGTLDPASVEMGNASLTGHLMKDDFFDVENHSEWKFVSKKVESDDGKYVAIGDMTVRGITKQVIIPFEFLGVMEGKRGDQAGFLGEFSIDRTTFDINYNPEGDNIGKTVRVRIALAMVPNKS